MNVKQLLQLRKEKGLKIADTFMLTQEDDKWIVPSQTGHGCYTVRMKGDIPICSCPDFQKRGIKCKHQFAVEITVTRLIDQEGNVTVTKTKKITYSQNWHEYDKAQTKQKEFFLKLLSDLCKTIPQPDYVFGRPKMPLSDMVFSSALKVFTTFSLRRFVTDIKTAKELGYIEKLPYFTTVARYMENQELTPIIKHLIAISSLPLKSIETDFTIDSTGFTTTRFARWFDFKYGKETEKRVWIKLQAMSGVKTNIITSVELTTTPEHDSKFLPQLLTQTAQNFQIAEISADKGYCSRNNMNVINEVGAMPYIPFMKGFTARAKGSSVWRKMWHYFMYNHDDFLQHYHKRSKAETVFHMIKSKFGDSIRSKTETAQVNEVLLKVLCHNICVVIQEMFELGIEPNFLLQK